MSHRNNDNYITNIVVGTVLIAIALLVMWFMFPMRTMHVGAGQLAVAVEKPYFFGNKGVRPEPVQSGRWWEWKTTEYILVKNTPYKQSVIIDDFVTIDNYRVDFQSQVILRVIDPTVLVDKWTLDFWNQSVNGEYSMMVRKEIKSNTLIDVMGNNVVLATIDDNLTTNLRTFIKERNIPVEVIGVTLGQARPNKVVFDQIEETARVEVERQTHVQRAASEEKRAEAESKRAAADNAYRNAVNLSPTQYAEMQIARMQTDACIKAAQCFIGLDRVAAASKR